MVKITVPYHIVIIGGGAGGLELAIRLTKGMNRKMFKVTLVDESLKFIWKPLYHEVAVGTVDYSQNEINYIIFTYKKGIDFVLGSFSGIDTVHKTIEVSPIVDEYGQEMVPQRTIPYDFLVLAVGSISNDFNIPGIKENCFFLDRLNQAEKFQKNFLNKILAFIQADKTKLEPLTVAIVGGGATGVELAAELKYALSRAISYSEKSSALINNLKIIIIESADRILPNLTNFISEKVTAKLQDMGIVVLTQQRVVKANAKGFETSSGNFISANMMVWSAGIKAPEFLTTLGLETNHLNQIVVNRHLQSVSDKFIFAIGDCAACPNPDLQTLVPPRAQAARQQAITLVKSLRRLIKNKDMLQYEYQDYGSLVSVSHQNIIGNLMGKTVGSFFIEGAIAQLSYLMLHKMHQLTLFGPFKTFLLTLSNLFSRKIKSGVKLH